MSHLYNNMITENIEKLKNGDQSYETCLKAIKENALAIQFVENQTDELCKIAININPLSIRFIKNQTSELCYRAVLLDISAFAYLKEQEYSLLFQIGKSYKTNKKDIETFYNDIYLRHKNQDVKASLLHIFFNNDTRLEDMYNIDKHGAILNT